MTGELTVEDDEQILANTHELLVRLNHTVVAVALGEAALAVVDDQEFDVLITDVGLVDMSGVDLAKKVRQRQPSIGVIFATGLDHWSDSHGERVLKKPYDIAALSQVLGNFQRRIPTLKD